METTICKGRDGWEAETTVDLGMTNAKGLPRVLVITTHKHSRGGISSDAAVFADGDGFREHIFGTGGDFRREVASDAAAPCTEKSIRVMHEGVLGRLSAITQLAKDHYAVAQPDAA